MSRQVIIALSVIVFMLHLWPMLHSITLSHRNSSAFKIDLPNISDNEAPPLFTEEFIGFSSEREIVHVASICELPDGRLVASWYGGSRVGAKDVAIYFTECDPSASAPWNTPKIVVNREIAEKELNRYIKKVGNSIIFPDSEGKLWLIYTTITIGGWACSSLNVKVSSDGGATWTRSQRFTLNPFLNFSALVRNKPLLLKDGRILLPIYHEFLGKFPEILHMTTEAPDQSCILNKVRVGRRRDYIQPSPVIMDSHYGIVFLRSCLRERVMATAVSHDGGLSWAEPNPIDLPNPNSGLDVLRLSDGRILIAFNDSKDDRCNLKLALSCDKGASWTRIATIENTLGERYSYPYMIMSEDGKIHLVYTWRNKRIKHIEFNEPWIDKKMRETLKKAGDQY